MDQQITGLPQELQRGLEEAVERIVEVARPQLVIPFGSYAETRAHTQSDLDILVVAATEHPFHLASTLMGPARAALRGHRVDILVITPAEWERLRHIPGQVVHEAAYYGVRLYEAA